MGNALLVARVNAGLTLREASKVSGVHKDVISRVERGVQPPAALTVGRLARAYGRDAGEFLGGSEERDAGTRRAARLREVRDKYRPYVEGLNAYIEDYVGLLESGTAERRDAAGFVRTLLTIGQAMLRVYRDELEDIADALGLARSAGEQIISGVPEEAVGASIDARLFEHSEMHAALQRYFDLAKSLADAVGDVEGAKAVRDTSRRVFGAAA